MLEVYQGHCRKPKIIAELGKGKAAGDSLTHGPIDEAARVRLHYFKCQTPSKTQTDKETRPFIRLSGASILWVDEARCFIAIEGG